MKSTTFFQYDVLIIGSGAAGYAAACRVREMSDKRVAIVTEGVLCGTSRNTGSDKQTYYKLGLGGESLDSVREMATDLFSCGAVDGDNALCEAALSARCFHYLCEAGVPFPHTAYGEYVGYKTDHDPHARASSAGPLTSKFMTEVLEEKAKKLNIPVHDSLLAVEILKHKDTVCGLLCLDLKTNAFVTFDCANLILATGGPAGIYQNTVYPKSQHGSTSLALFAGASLQNMTEWQYGLASVAPRWNVSGTYMQVLPRLFSLDENGQEREFLLDTFSDPYEALSLLFLKGYQWPFDAKKAENGSSQVDLLVQRETKLGRRVFLDFTKNPLGMEALLFNKLSDEAYTYLKNAQACFGTPIERLEVMNAPAIALYAEKGVDLWSEPLEIALCAQHNNGGIAVDATWQTEIEGLFAIGECAGTHGITRPGGSALNAGQVGALRAAQAISASTRLCISDDDFQKIANEAIEKNKRFCQASGTRSLEETRLTVKTEMSNCAAAIRDCNKMRELHQKTVKLLETFNEAFAPKDLPDLYRLRDILAIQSATLAAMLDYADRCGISRGSALYKDIKNTKPTDLIQHVRLSNGKWQTNWRSVRPIPESEDCFENVWKQYRKNQSQGGTHV